MSMWTGSMESESCKLLEIRSICTLSKNFTSLAKGSKSLTRLRGSQVKRPRGLVIASNRGKTTTPSIGSLLCSFMASMSMINGTCDVKITGLALVILSKVGVAKNVLSWVDVTAR